MMIWHTMSHFFVTHMTSALGRDCVNTYSVYFGSVLRTQFVLYTSHVMASLAKIFCWFTKRADPILSIVKLCVQPYYFSLISLWLCICQLSNLAIFSEISLVILNDDVLSTKMTRNHWWPKEFRRNIYLSRRFLLRFYNLFLWDKVLYLLIFNRVTIQALGQTLCLWNNFIDFL